MSGIFKGLRNCVLPDCAGRSGSKRRLAFARPLCGSIRRAGGSTRQDNVILELDGATTGIASLVFV
ncbi:hypothetical protein CDS [Bradyrhizobium sp.]|nr:hypothetical protein CDS [Bradyrhizobium sp.]